MEFFAPIGQSDSDAVCCERDLVALTWRCLLCKPQLRLPFRGTRLVRKYAFYERTPLALYAKSHLVEPYSSIRADIVLGLALSYRLCKFRFRHKTTGRQDVGQIRPWNDIGTRLIDVGQAQHLSIDDRAHYE